MNKLFYPRLAWLNIRKNRQTYFPYLLTCTIIITMFYLLVSIVFNENMKNVYGAQTLKSLLMAALAITIIFAFVFLFYTNSFLVKRRKKEIGLYNILGMEKRHIAKMMCFESLFISIVSLTAGILLGILLSKLIFLLLLKIISFNVILGFDIPIKALIATFVLFVCIFSVILLYNILKIRLTKTIELLHSTEMGEKEPKSKIILTLVGIGCIGWGYWFALTVESLMTAVNLFFIAVAAVVIGTYALFTAGSIVLLKLLRKNKKFYYKTSHFTSVSGMLYRMKQNAVGLANICILSTMVLILFSTTVSLYMGINDSAKARYPYNMTAEFYLNDIGSTEEIQKNLDNIVSESGIKPIDKVELHSLSIACEKQNGHLVMQTQNKEQDSTNSGIVTIIPLDEFNQLNSSDYTLSEGEILLYTNHQKNQMENLVLENGSLSREFHVKDKLEKIKNNLFLDYDNLTNSYVMVVDKIQTMETVYNNMYPMKDEKMIQYNYMFNTDAENDVLTRLSQKIENDFDISSDQVEFKKANSREDARQNMYGLYGGLLFIGLFLGILFLMATVLQIYYKQISEGFDDRRRFEIMQKVGLSRQEVKRTISFQVLLVFFIPLIVAAIHVAVSYKIVKKMLLMLGLMNGNLFIICTLISLIFFAVIYGIVFAITTRVYYKIVSD